MTQCTRKCKGCDCGHVFFNLIFNSKPFKLEPLLFTHPLVNTFLFGSSGNSGIQLLKCLTRNALSLIFHSYLIDDLQLTRNLDDTCWFLVLCLDLLVWTFNIKEQIFFFFFFY